MAVFTPYTSTADDFIVTRGEQLMERFYWRDEDWATQIECLERFAALEHVCHIGYLRGVETLEVEAG